MQDRIRIEDLEVFFHVGVPDQERASEQRLLISLTLYHDLAPAAARDDLHQTIDYASVTQQVTTFGEGRQWKLIEKLAEDIARLVKVEYGPTRVEVEVKKFILPETRYVSVLIER